MELSRLTATRSRSGLWLIAVSLVMVFGSCSTPFSQQYERIAEDTCETLRQIETETVLGRMDEDSRWRADRVALLKAYAAAEPADSSLISDYLDSQEERDTLFAGYISADVKSDRLLRDTVVEILDTSELLEREEDQYRSALQQYDDNRGLRLADLLWSAGPEPSETARVHKTTPAGAEASRLHAEYNQLKARRNGYRNRYLNNYPEVASAVHEAIVRECSVAYVTAEDADLIGPYIPR